ncbi:hypothetical protein D3C71_814490 [compost metagenome]
MSSIFSAIDEPGAPKLGEMTSRYMCVKSPYRQHGSACGQVVTAEQRQMFGKTDDVVRNYPVGSS